MSSELADRLCRLIKRWPSHIVWKFYPECVSECGPKKVSPLLELVKVTRSSKHRVKSISRKKLRVQREWSSFKSRNTWVKKHICLLRDKYISNLSVHLIYPVSYHLQGQTVDLDQRNQPCSEFVTCITHRLSPCVRKKRERERKWLTVHLFASLFH